MRARLTVALIFVFTISVALNRAGAQSLASEPEASSPSTTEITEIQKKAQAGDSSSAFALGRAYETGKGVPQDFRQAVSWYRKAAEQGDPKAQSSLGVLYWLGEGVDQDKKEAVQWYRKAARQGDASAMFNLGAAYYNGEGVQGDTGLAYAWFLLAGEAGSSAGRDAAERSESELGPDGFSEAGIAIGEMYEKGENLTPNRQLAVDWYTKASQGKPNRRSDEAKLRLAALYFKEADYTAARPWCESVANDRHLGGASCLGYLYRNGLGVTQDLKAAFGWYQLDAKKGGSVAAMYALGQMYEKGEGTTVDRAEAMSWFILSAKSNDAAAEARKLRASMNQKEWEAVRKRLQQHRFDLTKVDAFLLGDNTQTPH